MLRRWMNQLSQKEVGQKCNNAILWLGRIWRFEQPTSCHSREHLCKVGIPVFHSDKESTKYPITSLFAQGDKIRQGRNEDHY